MNLKLITTSFFTLICCLTTYGQLLEDKDKFTKQDTLRGSITPERAWWDLTYYHLDIEVNPDEKFISGKNTINYKVLESNNILQIDLQPPMKIKKVVQNDKELIVKHLGNAHFISLQESQAVGDINSLVVYYEGNPKEAIRAPWDGGFSWKRDNNDNHFIATSCQGLGASVWWPCKDHMYDEVDSMAISVTIPKGLMDVSNGRLRKVEKHENTNTYHWFVNNPINNYGVNINIGDYVHFSDTYNGEKGPLSMDYYVLRDNLEKAKEHFKDAPKTIEAFEHWFGPYPFYEDGFKLVEVPYLGMEHQSSVTYGNQYKKGYLGRDLSGTGWGLKWDYIIIHETGHEWFANNITVKDIADLWVQESFTTYSENLFIDYFYGKEAASEYVIGLRDRITNSKPMIGPYGVNKEGGDLYSKGANVLHTLRQLIEDDEKWRSILRGLNKDFYHQTVTSNEIESYISKKTGYDLKEFFDQYLRTTQIPTLEYRMEENILQYRWINVIEKFDMPVLVYIDNTAKWIYPNIEWKSLKLETKTPEIIVDKNFYVEVNPQ